MSRRPRAVVEQVLAQRLGTMSPGGLLASERPVRRHEGALRPPRVGGGGGPTPLFPLTLRPAGFYPRPSNADPVPVGGGGQGTFSDDSDSTYVPVFSTDTEWLDLMVTFPAVDLPAGAALSTITGEVRVRLASGTLDTAHYCSVHPVQVYPETDYYVPRADFWRLGSPASGSAFTSGTFGSEWVTKSGTWTALDSAAGWDWDPSFSLEQNLRDGVLGLMISTYYPITVDIADIALTFDGTTP